MLTQIILIGYRATGKTSVGKLLAAQLGCPFLDLDQELAKRQGQSIAELVTTHGWPYFRGLEKEMLIELVGQHNRVISTGGGAIIHQDIWPRIKATSLVVWLMADRETICRRLLGDTQTVTQRPTLTGSDTYAEIDAVLQEREPLYRAGCHFAVDTTTLGLEEIVEVIVERILGARASRPLNDTADEKAGGTPALPGWHSRGFVPHWEGGEIPQSVTFRLADSLPRTLLEQWREELLHLNQEQAQRERRERVEAALDAGGGECYLAHPEIASIVENALLHFDGKRYHLHAWVIMPNHVHVLFTPLASHTLSSIVHSWKSFTAKKANRVIDRTGAFWQEEYFDRAIRDENHFNKVIEYIHNNPVQAGLCDRCEDWPFLGARASRPLRDTDKEKAGGTPALP